MTTSTEPVAETPREPSQARLLLLVVEGYLYLVVVVSVFVAALALLVWGVAVRRPFIALLAVFVGLPLLLATASAIRSLFFRIPEPEGVVVSVGEAPALHRAVEAVRRRVGAPRVHRIIVGESFNASALQLARFGVLFPRHILFIGYPLFAILSPDHLRAVIAHELGHLSRAHGRLSLLVYRLRQSWVRLMAAFRARELTPAHAVLLFRWYAPRLHQQSTAVSRRQELLADRLVAEYAGSRVAAETVVAVMAGGTALEDAYWRDVQARADGEPEPPRPFAAMSAELWRQYGPIVDEIVSESLASSTEDGDTHPSLGERLAGLGEEARLPPIPRETAADAFLGAHAAVVAAALDATWRERHEAEWKSRHAAFQTRIRRLHELDTVAQPGAEGHYERGRLLEELEGDERALPHYEAAQSEGHAPAALAAGRIRLDREDESGVALIERAMDTDESLVPEACGVLTRFFERRGRLVEAHRYATRARRHVTSQSLANAERDQVTLVDRFTAHGLSDMELDKIISGLARERGVAAALLVTKEYRHSPGRELILALTPVTHLSAEQARRLQEKLILPRAGRVIVLQKLDEPLRLAIADAPGAEIYRRR